MLWNRHRRAWGVGRTDLGVLYSWMRSHLLGEEMILKQRL